MVTEPNQRVSRNFKMEKDSCVSLYPEKTFPIFCLRNVIKTYIYIYIYIYYFWVSTGESRTNSKVTFSNRPLHVDIPVLVDQQELTYNSSVRTQDEV